MEECVEILIRSKIGRYTCRDRCLASLSNDSIVDDSNSLHNGEAKTLNLPLVYSKPMTAVVDKTQINVEAIGLSTSPNDVGENSGVSRLERVTLSQPNRGGESRSGSGEKTLT